MTLLRDRAQYFLFVSSTVLLLGGGAAWLLDAAPLSELLWVAGTVLGLAFSVAWTAGAIRRGQLSVDVIALLALAGALLVSFLRRGRRRERGAN
jgi:hypothetical protein